jgi:hypothetical protein
MCNVSLFQAFSGLVVEKKIPESKPSFPVEQKLAVKRPDPTPAGEIQRPERISKFKAQRQKSSNT